MQYNTHTHTSMTKTLEHSNCKSFRFWCEINWVPGIRTQTHSGYYKTNLITELQNNWIRSRVELLLACCCIPNWQDNYVGVWKTKNFTDGMLWLKQHLARTSCCMWIGSFVKYLYVYTFYNITQPFPVIFVENFACFVLNTKVPIHIIFYFITGIPYR